MYSFDVVFKTSVLSEHHKSIKVKEKHPEILFIRFYRSINYHKISGREVRILKVFKVNNFLKL